MKLNVLILVLFLIISSNSNNLLDSFSIDGFKYYLKNNGLFEIIQSIKNAYGQDVAITLIYIVKALSFLEIFTKQTFFTYIL